MDEMDQMDAMDKRLMSFRSFGFDFKDAYCPLISHSFSTANPPQLFDSVTA